jgi:PAS domain S-box-containing protein
MADNRKPRILNVDDDAAGRYAITCILRKAGFAVVEAATGREALRLAEERPDLVVLDVNLPDINGFEVCRQIKANPRTADIPVVHLSATFVGSADRATGLEKGADGYLTQPLEPQELVATIKALLRLKASEAALREAGRQWQSTFDAVNDAICQLDADQRIRRCNGAMAALAGGAPQDLVGRHCWEVVHGTTEPIPGCPIERLRTSHRREGLELQWGDRWLDVTVDPILDEQQTLQGAVQIIRDITERKRAEERIKQLNSEMLQRLAELEALHRASREIMAAAMDPERVYASVHHVVAELMPCEAFVIVLQDQAGRENEAVYLVDQGGRWPAQRIPADQGLSGYVITQGTTLLLDDFSEEGDISAVHFGAPDPVRSILAVPLRVGQRAIGMLSAQSYRPHAYTKQDQALLETLANHVAAGLENIRLFQQTREQAQRVQGILDTVPEGVLLLGAEGQVLLANPVAEQDLRLLAGAQVGDRLTHLGERPLAELLAPPPHRLCHEVQAATRTFEVIARPIGDGLEPARWVLVLNDVTQERMVRDQLQQQERLAAIGQLAAGIAHDFNNVMAVVVLSAQMLQKNPDLSDKDRHYLALILDRARHATRLIGQILDFGRRSYMERAPLDLLPLLKEMLKLLERTLPESIRLELACDRDEYIVRGDSTRLQQAVMNLAANARDAMPAGGRLQFTLSSLAVGTEAPPPVPDMPAGEWVCLAVSDTGAGIAAEHLPHLFEPFFTTKEPGQGTGLGLSQVYGIVKQHEGSIGVHSRPGEGATFSLYLPLLTIPAPEVKPAPAAEAAPGGTETILLVEDELTVRQVVAETLEGLGYRVLATASGAEALAILERGRAIDLLLSDLVMPGLSGLDLYRALRRQRPALKGLIMTGYALVKAGYAAFQEEGVDWIQKPFEIEQLADKVRALLAEKASPVQSRPVEEGE